MQQNGKAPLIHWKLVPRSSGHQDFSDHVDMVRF